MESLSIASVQVYPFFRSSPQGYQPDYHQPPILPLGGRMRRKAGSYGRSFLGLCMVIDG